MNKFLNEAREHLSAYENNMPSPASEASLSHGLDCLEDVIDSEVQEQDKVIAKNIAHNYASKLISFVISAFSNSRPPVEDDINYIIRLFNIYSEHNVGVPYDFSKIYRDFFRMTFSSMDHQKLLDNDFKNVREYFEKIANNN